jgi:6-pyruvoyltetrahydropterin/6-carboxytetrahydropterin synthase
MATLKGETLDKTGMLVDFKIFKAALKKILSDLDHKYLNEHPAFTEINPTSENIARYIFMELAKSFNEMVERVIVYENEDSYAEYSLS